MRCQHGPIGHPAAKHVDLVPEREDDMLLRNHRKVETLALHWSKMNCVEACALVDGNIFGSDQFSKIKLIFIRTVQCLRAFVILCKSLISIFGCWHWELFWYRTETDDCILFVAGETMAIHGRLVVGWEYMVHVRATPRCYSVLLALRPMDFYYLYSFHVKISDHNKTAETISLKHFDVNIFHFYLYVNNFIAFLIKVTSRPTIPWYKEALTSTTQTLTNL